MKTILVATDFSENSNNACNYAIDLANEMNAAVILLHVFETPLLFAGEHYSVYLEKAEKKLNTYYEKLLKTAGSVKISKALQHGLPSARVVETALETKADLIIIGTTGKSMLERTLLGNNALRIFHHAPCPVLAVPFGCKFKGIKKIAYATDLKKDNITNANLLIPFAKFFNAEIVFLNVSDALEKDEFNNDLKKLTQQIKKYFDYPKMSGYLCNNLDVSEGVDYFLKHHAIDCLALFSHKRTLLQQIFGESITKRVSLHTHTPLLVISESDFTKLALKEKKAYGEIKEN